MFFVKMVLLSAILTKNISNVNDNINIESLSINDLLENIEFLTRSIIARKHKKSIGSLTILKIGKNLTRERVGGSSVILLCTTSPPKKSPSKKSSAFEFLNLSFKKREAFAQPLNLWAELRSARENFTQNDLSLIAEYLLNKARTHFSKNL